MSSGGKIPDLPFLSSKPDIEVHLRFDYNAFWTISTDRQNLISLHGAVLGPIPWTSIDRYALRHRIDGDAFARFERIMRLMDGAYRDYHKPKT